MKLVNVEKGITDTYGYVGITRVTKPHNEKPVGKFSTEFLRQAVELADVLEMEHVYAWQVPDDCEPPESHTLVFTPEKDSEIGIAAAGRLEQ